MKFSKSFSSVFKCLLTITLIFSAVPAAAETVLLGDGTILETMFSVTNGKKQTMCAGKIKNKYLPGRAVSISGSKLFIPLQEDMKTLKSKLKSATNAAAKRKVQKKIDKLKLRSKAENKLCKAGPDDDSGGPDGGEPTPVSGVPTTKPTATATPQPAGNFDSSGNVTSQGKTKFGIPSNLSANKESGRLIYNNTCRGCHATEETGRSFSYYKAVTQASPMFVQGLSDGDYANITAYLRRYENN